MIYIYRTPPYTSRMWPLVLCSASMHHACCQCHYSQTLGLILENDMHELGQYTQLVVLFSYDWSWALSELIESSFPSNSGTLCRHFYEYEYHHCFSNMFPGCTIKFQHHHHGCILVSCLLCKDDGGYHHCIALQRIVFFLQLSPL